MRLLIISKSLAIFKKKLFIKGLFVRRFEKRQFTKQLFGKLLLVRLLSVEVEQKLNYLFNVIAALDLFAGLDGADDDSDGDHDDRDVLGHFVATTKVIHSSQHGGDQTTLKFKQKKNKLVGSKFDAIVVLDGYEV
jgi:hypothetical protein